MTRACSTQGAGYIEIKNGPAINTFYEKVKGKGQTVNFINWTATVSDPSRLRSIYVASDAVHNKSVYVDPIGSSGDTWLTITYNINNTYIKSITKRLNWTTCISSPSPKPATDTPKPAPAPSSSPKPTPNPNY